MHSIAVYEEYVCLLCFVPKHTGSRSQDVEDIHYHRQVMRGRKELFHRNILSQSGQVSLIGRDGKDGFTVEVY